MTSIWIANCDLSTINDEADKWFPLETGGLFIGFTTKEGDIVITDITISGPDAIHEKSKFTPDYGYDENIVAKIYDHTKGISNYLGDWHTHPSGNSRLSWRDKRAMRSISKSEDAYLSLPTMGIVFGEYGAWKLAIYKLSKNWFFGSGFSYQNLCIHNFKKNKQIDGGRLD